MTITKLKKELRDQSAHAFAAAVIVSLANLAGARIGIPAGLVIGFGLGLVRELTEEGEISLAALKSALGSEMDLTFWTIGGAIPGTIAAVIAALA